MNWLLSVWSTSPKPAKFGTWQKFPQYKTVSIDKFNLQFIYLQLFISTMENLHTHRMLNSFPHTSSYFLVYELCITSLFQKMSLISFQSQVKVSIIQHGCSILFSETSIFKKADFSRFFSLIFAFSLKNTKLWVHTRYTRWFFFRGQKGKMAM